ncbi:MULTISPECIES: hypothetical protein [Pseudomonas syringae group]|uniref:Uncharacterized protein n=1 Tax=Pseudomonas syringae pv. coriandricola TaxID=264453 RepID=A0A0P9M9W4_9PSED|nr:MULTISPECIES: hypothetical protein [Pseudomonas syringae group]KPW79999.1 hypothetical protein ALO76_00489 [Pseudomonas syringae pv. coriandricola]RMN06245.1 hypothetical protein ALQ65_02095 [Pseudomonas syringae pv. coriandricola]
MSNAQILDAFGEMLVLLVRDRTIEKFEKIENGSLKSQKGQELHGTLRKFNEEQKIAIKNLIVETVDNSLFNLLDMLEQNAEKIELNLNKKNINLLSDGLSGELFTDDGWIKKFSKKK